MERLTETIVNGCGNIIECKNLLCKEVCKEHSCDDCPIQKTIDKLRDYEQAEEDGLLIKLPCRVGDVVYYFSNVGNVKHVEELKIYRLSSLVLLMEDEVFGKTVFLTKAEAEQALAKMENS